MAVKVKARAQITIQFIVDVKATYRYYLLQSSNLGVPSKPTTFSPSSPPSGWDDTEPSYTEESTNSLYFVDCTVFCDGTFQYSEVSLSSSYEAAKKAYNKAKSAIEIADGITMSVSNGIPGNKASIVLKVGNKEYSGTIDLTGAVTFSDLSTSGKTSINGGNIITNSITADQIASEAITADKIASGTITADKIASEAITADKIASKAITAGKIASKAIKTSKIASGAITADKIASGTITADKIASGTITADKINVDDIFSKNITATGQIQFKNEMYNFSIDPDSKEITIESFSKMTIEGTPISIISTGGWIGLHGANGVSLYPGSGEITINEQPLKSFIVESGTSGIWSYHKYSDGTCELWGRKTIKNLAISTAFGSSTAPGSWYRSSAGQPFGRYPFSVYNSSITTGFESTNGQSALTWASTPSSITDPYNVYLIRPTSSSGVSGILSIHVRGKLKA